MEIDQEFSPRTKTWVVVYCDDKDLHYTEYDYEDDAAKFCESTIWPYYIFILDDGHWKIEEKL